MLSNKRGNVLLESITVLVLLAGLIGAVILGGNVNEDLHELVQEDVDLMNSSAAQNIIAHDDQHYEKTHDYVPITVFIILILFSSIGAWFTETHPVFYAIMFIPLIFIVIGAFSVQVALDDTFSDAEYATQQTAYPLTTFLLNNFTPMYSVGIMIVLIIGFLRRTGT